MSAAQHTAALLLFECLARAVARHAFIGGFALNMLGHARPTTDIDVLIDAPAGDARGLVLRATADIDDSLGSFSQQNNRIMFAPVDGSLPFPVETLAAGILGLPLWLKTIDHYFLPLLDPAVLILAKIKRCVVYVGSTQPASVVIFSKAEGDIVFLARLLVDMRQTVDFEGYAAEHPSRIYQAVSELLQHWVRASCVKYIALLRGAMTAEDVAKLANM